jgi:hypothetical protein
MSEENQPEINQPEEKRFRSRTKSIKKRRKQRAKTTRNLIKRRKR